MKVKTLTLTLLLAIGQNAMAQKQQVSANPYLPLWEHLPDGEPRVFEDPDNPGKYRVYIIGSHDTRFGSYCGSDVREWSAPVEDLSDWRDEGPIFTYQINGKWDVMYAPDLNEIVTKDGKKEYVLVPHSTGNGRRGFVAKGPRPNGPFTLVNRSEDGLSAVPGSVYGFDPSMYIERITDEKDPDFKTGFRVYGFWGFQHVDAAELDPNTFYSKRPGTEIIRGFIPASKRYGELKEGEGTTFPHVFPGEDLGTFNFFEAASIRKVGNKYVWIYSGYSGPDYGLSSTNSTLRYAYGDTPLGPWKSGGVLVDSRGIVLNEDGTKLEGTNFGHNTHGSIEEINGQWYCFYHRPPRGFGNARQAMVAPIHVEWDEKSVADGGAVRIRAYDPYAKDGKWTCRAKNGDEYKGAEVTSEGFNIFGLNPYEYYSAGYACHLNSKATMKDNWDVWNNHMTVGDIKNGAVIGFKYFGFGGLNEAKLGLKPFEGTKPGNGTKLEIFLDNRANVAYKINVWMDGPVANKVWKGKKLGTIEVAAGSKESHYTLDVSSVVDKMDKKHAIYLVAEGPDGNSLFDLLGIGFSNKNKEVKQPVVPQLTITVDGNAVKLPSTPVRSNEVNGYTDATNYAVCATPVRGKRAPKVEATADNSNVKISVVQPTGYEDNAVVRATFNGKTKTYTISFNN